MLKKTLFGEWESIIRLKNLMIIRLTKPFLVFFLPLDSAFLRKFRRELLFRTLRTLSMIFTVFLILSYSLGANFKQSFLTLFSITILILVISKHKVTKLNFILQVLFLFLQSFVYSASIYVLT